MENDILDINLSKNEPKLVVASKSKRLANYIIDRTLFTIMAGMIFIYADLMLGFDLENINRFTDIILTALILALLYSFCEIILKGKTIGKFITGTRAVMRDTGTTPDANTFIARSFSCVVPFEAFSFLGDGDGWHDKWTDTIVIDEKESQISDAGW